MKIRNLKITKMKKIVYKNLLFIVLLLIIIGLNMYNLIYIQN